MRTGKAETICRNNEAERKEPETRPKSGKIHSWKYRDYRKRFRKTSKKGEENTVFRRKPTIESSVFETDKTTPRVRKTVDERAEYTADNAKPKSRYTPPDYRGKRINMKIKNRKNNKLITAIVIAVWGYICFL